MTNLVNWQNKEIFRWGPVQGRFFYNSDFAVLLFEDKNIDIVWPEGLFLFRDKKMVWLNDYEELRNAGKECFLKYICPKEKGEKLRNQWKKKDVAKLKKFQQEIRKEKLSKLSKEELSAKWEEFYSVLTDFWNLTLYQELGNYGSDKLLEEKIKETITDQAKIHDILEILTAPEELSFYQEEEIDLIETKNLEAHQKKYFWLKNSYGGTQVLPVEFFKERKEKLEPNIKEIVQKRLTELKKKKVEIKEKYNLSREVIEIADALSFGVTWQDERKKYIFQYLHYKELFLKEIAKRLKIDEEDLRNFGVGEIIEMLKGKDLSEEIKDRRKGYGFYLIKNKMQALNSEETNKYWEMYGEEKVNEEIKEFKGIVASKGINSTVKGKVKILLDPYDISSFSEGDILVAPMTSPEYVFAIKKSSAIITDAGGITSHAAIVSRELNKPCIIGTKIATKVLKDGDLVEVDANNGIVKKIQ